MQQQIAGDRFLQFQAGLAKIRERFVLSLPERVAEFDQLLDDLYEDGDTEKVVETIGQRAHRLHGQAGSFGFAPVGDLAAKLDQEVDRVMRGPRPMDTEGVEVLLVSLLDLIEASLSTG